MKVQIYIQGNDDPDNEILRLQGKSEYKLTDFIFSSSDLRGFWIDKTPDERTGTIDMTFYAFGENFRTPWTFEKEKAFTEIIEKNDTII